MGDNNSPEGVRLQGHETDKNAAIAHANGKAPEVIANFIITKLDEIYGDSTGNYPQSQIFFSKDGRFVMSPDDRVNEAIQEGIKDLENHQVDQNLVDWRVVAPVIGTTLKEMDVPVEILRADILPETAGDKERDPVEVAAEGISEHIIRNILTVHTVNIALGAADPEKPQEITLISPDSSLNGVLKKLTHGFESKQLFSTMLKIKAQLRDYYKVDPNTPQGFIMMHRREEAFDRALSSPSRPVTQEKGPSIPALTK